MTDKPSSSVDPAGLREPMARRLYRRSVVTGQITLPAVPDMIDEYVKMCDTVFAGVGVRFTTDELAHLRGVLESELAKAYSASQRSTIVVSYDAPVGTVLNYRVRAESQTIGNAYDNWVATRQPPLFGTEPDARVWSLAGEATDPRTCRVLDIGAGTGRNALALARRGHPVDVIEMTPRFVELIRSEVEQGSLNVNILQRDMFALVNDLHWDYRLIVLSEVVPDFRDTEQLRGMFEIAARHLTAGGRLVFNVFLPRHGYVLEDAARQLGQQCYSMIFSWDEMNAATAGLPLELVADDSVYEYEKKHLPEGAWPPTGWYAEWVSGQDVFDVERDASPIEMRWLVYQKRAANG